MNKERVIDAELLPLVNHPSIANNVDLTEIRYEYPEGCEQLDVYDLDRLHDEYGINDVVKWKITLVGVDHSVEAASYVGFADAEVMVYILSALLRGSDDSLGVWDVCNREKSTRAWVVGWFKSWLNDYDIIEQYSGFDPGKYPTRETRSTELTINVDGHKVVVTKEQ